MATSMIIGPRGPRLWDSLLEAWRGRELLAFLVWRDVKIRYAQAALGAAWAVLQPLAAMLVFAVVFGHVAKLPSDGVPYASFCYVALVPWTFFANAVSGAGNSLLGAANVVTKVYFPRIYVPAAPILAGVVDLAIAYPLLFVLMAWQGVVPSPLGVLALPALAAIVALLAFGVGAWFAALNAQFRDVRHALPFLVQIWMFASPVVYPYTLATGRARLLLAANPMTGILEMNRAVLLGRPFPWLEFAWSLAATGVIVWTGLSYFNRVERHLADVI